MTEDAIDTPTTDMGTTAKPVVRLAARHRSALTLALALGALAAPPLATAQQVDEVTLDQAVEMAMQRSPTYTQAIVGVDNAEETRRTAIGAFLPSLSVSSGASMRPGSVFDPDLGTQVSATNRSVNGGVSVGMNLYSGGRNRAELDAAGIEIDAAEASLEGQRFQLILQTTQSFLGVLEQADLYEVTLARVDRAEESLDIVRRQVTVGAATASDSLRASLELANARQAALQSEASVRSARMGLGRQVGVAGPVEAAPLDDLEPTPISLSDEEIFRIAETASPDVRAAELSARASGASLSSSRASYLPTARLSTGYNWSNNEWGIDGGEGRWSGLSLSLSYSVFSGFSREAGVARAENQVRVARLQEEDARLAAREEADAALFALRTAEQAVEIAEVAAGVAAEDLRIVRERFEVGVATVFEVITSQIALDEAEANRVSTRYDYLIARAQLESILGQTL